VLLVEALEHAGAEVVELPLTRQVDAADDGRALRAAAGGVTAGRFAWVVLTSVNAVDRFMAELRDARALSRVLVAAVGPATADALRRSGVEPDLVPAHHSARGLVERFPDASSDAAPVLFPCADIAPDTVVDGLSRKGWLVDRVTAYRTVPVVTHDRRVLARVAAADAVVFTASSSVLAFSQLRGPDGSAVPVPGHVVCIGPATAEAARVAGYPGVHQANEASTDGIVAELADHFGHPGDTP
jgi:uroporphyrinogen III methyltransferase / synthase